MKSKKVHIFICVFFSGTNELGRSLHFIKKKIGNYDYFSHNIRHKSFPLSNELFSVFYAGDAPRGSQVYRSKLIGITNPISLKRIHRLIKKIKKFQKSILSRFYFHIPILIGYLADSKIISIYASQGGISIPVFSGQYHQLELSYKNISLAAHDYTLSLFQRKDYISLLDDLRRIRVGKI